MMLTFALAGGSLIFLIVIVVLVLAVAFGYYTVRGSGISLTPYRRSGGPPESPPQITPDITQEVRNWDPALARLSTGAFTDEAEMMDLAAASVPDGDRLKAEVSEGRHRARIAEQIRRATASGAHLLPEVYIDGAHYQEELKPDALRSALAG